MNANKDTFMTFNAIMMRQTVIITIIVTVTFIVIVKRLIHMISRNIKN